MSYYSSSDIETKVSIILGALVVIIIGSLIFYYFKSDNLEGAKINEELRIKEEKRECEWVQVEDIRSMSEHNVLYKADNGKFYYDYIGLDFKLIQPNQGICVKDDLIVKIEGR
jgi:hypothetical protein